MRIVFSDLDGSLLDRSTYSFEAARPALHALMEEAIPLVLVTSKTSAEMVLWRGLLNNQDPFVVENGAAVYVPAGYFPFELEGARNLDGFHVFESGAPYPLLARALREASEETGCNVHSFGEMTPQAVAAACGIPLEQAELAKRRQFSEAFRILDPRRTRRLLLAIQARGYQCTRGGRFYHIHGANDKSAAVKTLAGLYARLHGVITTIGLGDGMNDAPLLNAVDIPVIIRSRFWALLKSQVPLAAVSEQPGPAGWNRAIVKILAG